MLNPGLLRETVVPFFDRDRRKLLAPTGEHPPNRGQLSRWSSRGLKNKLTGRRVKLEHCWFGPNPATSVQAFGRFLEKLNSVEEKT